MSIRALAVSLTVIAPTVAAAQSPSPSPAARRPPLCAAQEARQFDFWAGDWDVYVRGALGGHNLITKEHGGCALVENWSATGGPSTGTSINFYDPARGKWHQTWAGSGGSFLLLDGGWNGERMVLEGERTQAGTTARNRISWQPLPGGHVRQTWETAQGTGEWTVAFDGIYVPKGSPPPATSRP